MDSIGEWITNLRPQGYSYHAQIFSSNMGIAWWNLTVRGDEPGNRGLTLDHVYVHFSVYVEGKIYEHNQFVRTHARFYPPSFLSDGGITKESGFSSPTYVTGLRHEEKKFVFVAVNFEDQVRRTEISVRLD